MPTVQETLLDRVVEFFRKCSGKYKMDRLLMTAQGYQESQFNQESREKAKEALKKGASAVSRCISRFLTSTHIVRYC